MCLSKATPKLWTLRNCPNFFNNENTTRLKKKKQFKPIKKVPFPKSHRKEDKKGKKTKKRKLNLISNNEIMNITQLPELLQLREHDQVWKKITI